MLRLGLQLSLLLVIASAPTTCEQTATTTTEATPTTQSVTTVSRVLVVSVDGLRPDLLLRADMPVVRGLMKRGSYSFWARTIPEAITLPSHVSMMTGVAPQVHGVTWNDTIPTSQIVYPPTPTLFELAKGAGLSTAMIAGKRKFDALAKPGTIDWLYVPGLDLTPDADVASNAIRFINEYEPQVMFVHLGDTDSYGHRVGWGTAEQIAAIENADRQIGRVLKALEEKNLLDQTLIILSADHGGAGRTHGSDDPRSRHIPWIVAGPGIRQNVDLTIYPDLIINTQDTFATACMLLNLPLPDDIEGKPILQILDNQELLQAAP